MKNVWAKRYSQASFGPLLMKVSGCVNITVVSMTIGQLVSKWQVCLISLVACICIDTNSKFS